MKEASIIIELILIFAMKLRREAALHSPTVEGKLLRRRIASATSQKTGVKRFQVRYTGKGEGACLAHS